MAIQLTVMSLDFESIGRPSTTVFRKNELTLGRFPENDVVLNRPEVSGWHAKLRVEAQKSSANGATLYITDLGSSNGTMVENNALKPEIEIALHPNERIIIGNFLIKPQILGEESEESEESEEEESVNGSDEAGRKDMDLNQVLDMLGEEQLEEESGNNDSGKRPEIDSSFFSDLGPEASSSPFSPSASSASETSRAHEHLSEDLSSWPEASAYAETEEVMPGVDNPETETDVEETSTISASVLPAVSSAGAMTKFQLDGMHVVDLNFEAVQIFAVRGSVLHKGLPLFGIEIEAGDLGHATSRSDGSFSFEKANEGTTYSVLAMKPGFIFEYENNAGVVNHDVAITIRATQLFSIRGTVLHRGKPLSGVKVDAVQLGSVTTGEDGSFVFASVPEGKEYRLTASKSGFLVETPMVQGRVGGGDVQQNFSVRQLFTISGRVTHKGAGLAGAEIDGGPLGKTTTDDDGVYRFEDVAEGSEYTITARKDGFVFSRQGVG